MHAGGVSWMTRPIVRYRWTAVDSPGRRPAQPGGNVAVDKDYLAWVLEQLSGAGGISIRRMFGAIGLYRGDVFFAIISDGSLYFKVGDSNRAEYDSRHMPRFRPYRDRPELSMTYYEVPADVIEDPEECVAWALRSVAAAGNRPAPRKKSPVVKRGSTAARKKVGKRRR
jgi:DNA transformation protein and related proteins